LIAVALNNQPTISVGSGAVTGRPLIEAEREREAADVRAQGLDRPAQS
jgi:hypothetical protein